MKFFWLAAFTMISLASPCMAETSPPSANKDMVDISASGSLEWQRDAKSYVARGDVVIKQGDIQLSCDRVTASYSNANKIDLITADGKVHVSRPPHEAFGDRAVYDVARGLITLTGSDLRLVTPDETLTARDKIEYSIPDNRLDAIGNPKAVKDGNSLTAGHFTAFFESGGDMTKTKSLELREIRAENDVVIMTPKETVYGSSGIWNAKNRQALLKGPVTIMQGANKLEGDHVTVDMKTGLSQLFAGPGGNENQGQGGGRVRGVFYPGTKENK